MGERYRFTKEFFMKKQSKKFMLAGVVLLAIAGLLALTSCKNDSVPEQGTSVQEETWLQEQKKELEGKTEGTYTITAPSYLTEGGLVKIRKLLDGANVPVDLDLSKATGLTYIAAGTFVACFPLQSVKLPSSVTEIGDFAFYFCNILESVTIPEGVTTIGDSAFYFCSSLTEVTIPASVKTIKESAFFECSNLTSVTIHEGVTTIRDAAFASTGLTEVTIPTSVTTIGSSAFSGCQSLTSVTILADVATIGASAFMGCSNLTKVTFQKTDGWHMKNPYDEAESPESIDVSKPEDNAEKLREGDWHNKYLIRK